jgi:ATP-dependent DNA helicase DinG
MGDYIDEAFGPGGHLSRALPGYEPRRGQVDLARAVDRAIRDSTVLLGEAGTGVGKSFAYAVPAVWHAVHEGRRVLVVTANLNLQDQLAGKDLPLLRACLPWPFDFAVMKGRANYLCLDRHADSLSESVFGSLFGRREEVEQWDRVNSWAAETTGGDVAELPFEPLPSLRQRFTVGAEDCLGRACPRHGDCFANRAKVRAESAHVVVANYHLLFAHLQVVRGSGGEAAVLPPFDAMVLDEANRAADIARDFFGARVTAGACRWAARLLAGKEGDLDPELKERISGEADRFFEALGDHAASPAYRSRLRRADSVRDWGRLVGLMQRASSVYLSAAGTEEPKRKEQLRKCASRCEGIVSAVTAAMSDPAGDDDRVYFVDRQGDRVALASKAIDVSGRLRAELFEAESVGSVTCTSATLRVGASFEFFSGEVGVAESHDVEELVAESPFDFREQCLLVVPRDAPDPKLDVQHREAARLFVEACRQAGGRTLGLFTSYRSLTVAHELASARLPYRVMRQGEAPRHELVRRFREDKTSVLLGAESFWSGVDVPGEALSCVVMDRLPFPNPSDPVMDALAERDDDSFRNQSLPRATTMFRQGFGRLIRASTDRGAVVCLDSRLLDKPYGKLFLKCLPAGVRMSRDLADVGRFLASSAT